MKKFGFTLAEILLSMAIIGVVAAITAPTLTNMMPNKNKMLTLKYQKMITEINAELLNNRSLYENGKFDKDYDYAQTRDESLLFLNKNGKEYKYLKENKYAYLFMKNLTKENDWQFSDLTSNPGGDFTNKKVIFKTADGIEWTINDTSGDGTPDSIGIDINGFEEGPNKYSATNIKSPDQFVFKIDSETGMAKCDEKQDKITCRYLACPYYMNNKRLDYDCMTKYKQDKVSKNDKCYCWSK